MSSSPNTETKPDSPTEDRTTSTLIGRCVDRCTASIRGAFLLQFGLWLTAILLFTETVAAANGVALANASRDPLDIPQWLYISTGGATVGASALLATFVTDRVYIRSLHTWSLSRFTVENRWQTIGWIGRWCGVCLLVLAVYVGFTGPQLPNASLTVLLTFVGIRAVLPMVAYLGGNLWPAINPWRALVSKFPTGIRTYPEQVERWPAVAGLLLLVWVEVVFPVSTIPRVLSMVIIGYTAVTIVGAVLFGSDPWFTNADPLSVLFRFYGAVAPIQRDSEGISVKLPGSELTDSDLITDTSDVAFVVALVWELTYSGFITTQAGASTIEAFVGLLSYGGVQARAIIVYTVLLVSGYIVFFGAYWYAGTVTRRLTGTYLSARLIAFRFAPPLAAIAAGYHLAHYTGLAVSLGPALGMALAAPLAPPANPLTLAPPGGFNALSIAFVLVGHLLAIWTAHGTAYELFSSRLVAIRSQYPYILVMIGYTVISLWILSLPGALPPYLS